MTLYEQLFTVSWTMIQMSKQENWEDFFEAEKERASIIKELEDNKREYPVTESLLKRLIVINKTLEKILQGQQCVTKSALLKLQKGKKASGFYLS